ncbi:DUF1573 domain-containing protein [Galbibacter sp.]|uniref:DUF1573 domain-containing protein n=1 Tax=Galbibacter sp. TaxID=2918471 RepID=UPI003A9162C9
MKTKMWLLISVFLLALSACGTDIKNRKTSIEIVDNNRHYWPILTGQELEVVFFIKNTGEFPLIIDEVITSCGCLHLSDKSTLGFVPRGETGVLRLNYDSKKNVGFVKHYITLYGNFETHDTKEAIFDINIVPDALYTKDYEELYFEEQRRAGNIKRMVDGQENNKGYYLDKS